MNDRLSDDELKDLLSQKATPAPWYVRHLDNDHAMSLTAVSTVPDTGNTSVGRNLTIRKSLPPLWFKSLAMFA
jgi:hypothetical protein